MRLRPIAITVVVALALALGWPVAASAAAPTPAMTTITVADSALSIGETSLVTITFGEAVTGFTNADLAISNGTLTPVSSSDGGITWTATLTPTTGITDPSNLITLDLTGVQDASGNPGSGTATSNNYAVDTERPTATVVFADNALAAGETSLVTITFSEAITGFTNSDVTVANGTLSALSSSDGGITWTAVFTPTAGVADTSNVMTVALTGVADIAGNAGTGSAVSPNYTVNTVRPTAAVVVADTALTAGETTLATITFSEAVSGFDNTDLAIANATLSAVSSSDGGITWTATLMPAAGITDATNVITLDLPGVQNGAGSAGAGSIVSNNYAVNTVRPTATIVVADADLAAGETSPVTITFSEAVAGFATSDLTVENGMLSEVSSTDGGVTFTATLTPTFGITDATNVITLDLSGLQNASGNTGTGTTTSNNYAVTAALMLMITVVDDALAAGQTSPVTFRFSRAVTGFTNADVTVSGGTLSAVTSADGGVTFTAALTPTANSRSAGNTLSVDLAGVTDSVTNAPGNGVTMSNIFVVDTVAATPAARLLAATGVQASGILISGLLMLLLGAGVFVARRRHARA